MSLFQAPPGAKNDKSNAKVGLPLVKSLAGRKDMVDHDRIKVACYAFNLYMLWSISKSN